MKEKELLFVCVNGYLYNMMIYIKNILFVSYLKNKGIRRICFIIGLGLFAYCFLTSVQFYKNTVIEREFKNLYDLQFNNTVLYDTKITQFVALNECAKDFFESKDLNIGNSWNISPIDRLRGYTEDEYNENIKTLCDETDENYCSRLKYYDNHPIKLNCGKSFFYISRLIILPLSFYLPFILMCLLKILSKLVKWIFSGFKEK